MTKQHKLAFTVFGSSVITTAGIVGMSLLMRWACREDQRIAPHIEPWGHIILLTAVYLFLCVLLPVWGGVALLSFLLDYCEKCEGK